MDTTYTEFAIHTVYLIQMQTNALIQSTQHTE